MLARRLCAAAGAARQKRALSAVASLGGFGHTLSETTRPGIFTLTLSREEVHNAINDEMIRAISDTLDGLKDQPGLRAVFVRGSGKSFCAGGDLKWMRNAANLTPEQNERDSLELAKMLQKLATLPCATVALVQGNAFGGGVGMISACDVAVGVRSAKFALSEVKLGILPATISPYVVPRIGPNHARRYFLTAELFAAPKAMEIGLLHEVCEDATELEAWADHFADSLALCAPSAVAASKELINAVENRERDDALLLDTARRLSAQRASSEGREGLDSFLNKRKPSWTS